MRILVVEDERKIAQILVAALETEHYDVVVAPTGEDGFFRANAEAFDLVVSNLYPFTQTVASGASDASPSRTPHPPHRFPRRASRRARQNTPPVTPIGHSGART